MLSTPIALELLVGFGIPLAWAGWELVSLRREQARDRAKAAAAAAEAQRAEAAASPAAASETAAASEPTVR